MLVICIVTIVLLVAIPILADHIHKKGIEAWAVEIVIKTRMHNVIERLGLE